jgi:hypothetical protein
MKHLLVFFCLMGLVLSTHAAVIKSDVRRNDCDTIWNPKDVPSKTNLVKKKVSIQKFRLLQIDLAQAIQKGVAIQYESNFGERASFTIDAGIRLHPLNMPETQFYYYEETTRSEFWEKQTTYSPSPPIDFGDFLPKKSLNIALSQKIYGKKISETGPFFQAQFHYFFHQGLKISDSKTLLSRESESFGVHGSEWFSYADYTITKIKWEHRRTASKSTRTSLGLSLAGGYHFVIKKKIILETGVSIGRTMQGSNYLSKYYGLNEWYARPFLMLGYKLN